VSNASTAAPSETVICSFSTTDGANPSAIARGKNGNFYGTAAAGGANQLGTVFELTEEGVLTRCTPSRISMVRSRIRS
jgi:uncharacterized repeat protein (TIGR03803 family)